VIWAWFGAAAVGLAMGLLGSGGAILTIPILVYFVGHDEKIAIAESLVIVGAIAVTGVIRASMQKQVDFRSAALLAFPGIVGTLAGAHAAQFISGAVQLALLACLMLAASALMLKDTAPNHATSTGAERTVDSAGGPVADDELARSGAGRDRVRTWAVWVIAAQGVGLGLATGLVGVGGGFLIVPVLVLLRRLPMPTAVGTSLAIIAVNSGTGFLKYLSINSDPQAGGGPAMTVDWTIIGVFIALGVAGSQVGNALSGRIHQQTLKRVFAVFLIVMAGYILVRQAPRALPGAFGTPKPATTVHWEPREGTGPLK